MPGSKAPTLTWVVPGPRLPSERAGLHLLPPSNLVTVPVVPVQPLAHGAGVGGAFGYEGEHITVVRQAGRQHYPVVEGAAAICTPSGRPLSEKPAVIVSAGPPVTSKRVVMLG